MPIHFRENQYRGVNAHLHSYLQQHNKWAGFHNQHVTHLLEALQRALPEDTGYWVVNEDSLQIIQEEFLTEAIARTRTIADINIYKQAGTTTVPASSAAATPSLILPLSAVVVEPEPMSGIVIYAAGGGDRLGRPVTRIELLSPANKPPGSHYQQYVDKRNQTLLSGISLVEIDYLHERPSAHEVLPDYTKRDEESAPYTILVSVPIPSWHKGDLRVYKFRVDDTIPTIAIPLDDENSVTFDFGTVYNHTFAANNVYGMLHVDYATLPEGFDTYDEEDQRRIRARMAEVAQLSASS